MRMDVMAEEAYERYIPSAQTCPGFLHHASHGSHDSNQAPGSEIRAHVTLQSSRSLALSLWDTPLRSLVVGYKYEDHLSEQPHDWGWEGSSGPQPGGTSPSDHVQSLWASRLAGGKLYCGFQAISRTLHVEMKKCVMSLQR
ncbi:hypothetical protein AOLI_G00127160 [Acnodon oligacanthus]